MMIIQVHFENQKTRSSSCRLMIDERNRFLEDEERCDWQFI